MSKKAIKLALEALTKNSDRVTEIRAKDQAITALREALAEQPAQQQVALDVTLEGDEARALYDLLGDDREDLSPVRLLVGDGHSGYGLYAALAEYQDEGAELIASITPPAQQEPDWLDKQQTETDWDHVWLLIKAASYASSRGFISGTSNWGSAVSRYMRNESPQPAQRKPLTVEEIENILPDDDTPMSLGEAFVKFARIVEAAHGIKENT